MRPARFFMPLLVIVAGVYAPMRASAHPVILITYKMQFTFTAEALEGFYETWSFDKPHSQLILKMFDADNDGQIDHGELPALAKGYFDDLADYNYFTSLVVNGKERPTKTVSDFSAVYRDGHMIYRFFVPLHLPVAAQEQELDVTIWDPTYYTDLSLDSDQDLSIAKPDTVNATVGTANDHRHFYNLAPGVTLVKKPPFYLKMIALRFHFGG